MSTAVKRFANGRVWATRSLVFVLAVALAAPPGAFAGNGKKHAKKGLEHEVAERWEEAAMEFALAASDEPDNAEYRLHLARALTNASLMLTKQGDRLAEQKDYNQALIAYRKAYEYDRGNELAGAKMQKMRELLGLPAPGAQPEKSVIKVNHRKPKAILDIPRQNRVLTNIEFRKGTSLRSAINMLASELGLNVFYDDQFKDRSDFEFEAKDIPKAKALELMLLTNKLFYVQADTRSIIVAQDTPQNRTRYQAAVVRTFYLKNADLNDVRTLIQQVVQTKAIVPNKQLNALTVRDTPNNVELIEQLVASLDKDRAEVLVDVQVYEVNRSDLLSFGNQFKVDPTNDDPTSISFLGGVGAESLRATAPVGAFGPIGLALALPRSTFSALQSKTKARLLSSSQIHVLDGEQHTIRVGQRVPIRTAQFYTGTSVAVTGDGRNNNPQVSGVGFGGSPATQFQYENVGLNIDVTPTIREDLVQLKMKIETSGIGGEGVGKNPIFTQRQLSSVASIRDGQPTLIAGVSSINKTDSRSGLALIGLIPILGRLFTIPSQQKEDVDVVIVVTPHIMRAPVFEKEDHEAIASGTVTNADRQIPIEEIIYRAQLEEQEAAKKAPIAKAPRSTTTEMVVDAGEPASATRPVGAKPGETIKTPGGLAAPPVVAPEESARPRPGQVRPVMPQPTVEPDEEEDVEDDEEEDPGASAKAAPAAPGGQQDAVDVKLAGLETARTGRPVTVSLLGLGNHSLNAAKIAIKFDSQVLRFNKVESTGAFSGALGSKLPYELRGDVLILDLTTEGGSAAFNGQVASITFDVLAAGTATLAVVPDASSLVGASGAQLGLRFGGPLQILAR